MRNYSEHYKGSDSLLSRIRDWVSRAERDYCSVVTPFLNEFEIEVVKRYCGNKIPYVIDGGHPDAQRAKIIFLSQTTWESDIVCLVAKRKKGIPLEHRDILGALMSLNIDRNQLGDLWVEEDKIVLYTSQRLSTLIQQECKQVHRVSIQFELSDKLHTNQVRTEEGSGFISSARIDSIVSCVAKKSRADAQVLIQSQRVMVNHQIVTKLSKICQEGDIISIRKVGRFVYKGVVKTSKKNKLLIDYEKYVG